MAACSFDGCGKEARSRGLCVGHYAQTQRGEPLRPLQVQYHGLSEYDRLMMRINKGSPNECWNWTGSRQGKKNGDKWYGQWRNIAGNIELAHRAAWRLLKGEIPEGMCILHRCDNPACCNPSHLFLGTQSDNSYDMWGKGRARPGTSRGEKHGMAKLTADKVRAIRSSEGTDIEIGARFGVSRVTVYEIRIRKTWKHID